MSSMLTEVDQLSPRESILMEKEVEENRLARDFELTKLKMELDSRRANKELEVKLQELRVAQVHEQSKLKRLPVLLLKILLFPFLGLAIIFTIPLSEAKLRDLLEFLA
jgi:hypothetical protein